MNRITSNRVVVFIVVMSAVALIVYLPHYGREQRQAQQVIQQQQTARNQAAAGIAAEKAAQEAATKGAAEREAAQAAAQKAAAERAAEKEAAQAAAQKAAAEHAQFMARYVDTTFTKKPGVQAVALSVATADGKSDRTIQDALMRRFQTNAVQLVTSFFKPSFVSDGLFASAFNDSKDVSKKLELAKSLDEMLLAKVFVEYSTNGPDLQNVITATIRLEVAVIPVAGNAQGRTWTFTAAGAGFSQTAAQAMAEERLTKQIAEDKKMSL